jgi:hypothetical protein
MNRILTAAKTLAFCAAGVLEVGASLAQSIVPRAPEAADNAAETVLRLTCNYCIAASDITIQRTDGTVKRLSRLDMRAGPSFHNVSVWTTDKRSRHMRGSPSTGHDATISGEYIEWKPEYVALHKPYPQKYGVHHGIPVVVPIQASVKSWSDLVRTEHVCVGSRFLVPTFYFIGSSDKLPMQDPPIGGIPRQGAHARELPPTSHQTICDGELLPIKEVDKATSFL